VNGCEIVEETNLTTSTLIPIFLIDMMTEGYLSFVQTLVDETLS